ncbi:MAG: aminoacyl-tRNA hydrolase [Nitrospinota bacterium]|nr:MAG: aminoacyl-tRNA hydrolase [Nitrospinota bacterium]
MRILVGLGNPGGEYERTRHNVGFWALDALAEAYQIELKPSPLSAHIGRGTIAGTEVILAKPMTFMNRSGVAVRKLSDAYQAAPSAFLLLHDDIDLPPGTVRVKWRGGDAGHRGVRSVIEHLGTNEVLRIRIGVGRPPPGEDVSAYVLSCFPEEERRTVEEAIREVVLARVSALLQGKIRDPRGLGDAV